MRQARAWGDNGLHEPLSGRAVSLRGLGMRWALVAVVALGLVGMHHLVIACHHAAPVVSAGAVAADHAHHAPVPPAEHEEHGAVGAAAVCLAVLLGFLSLLVPPLRARARRDAYARAAPRGSPLVTRFLEPPDLNLLSIART